MGLITFLIGLPIIVALILLVVNKDGARDMIVRIATAALVVGSIALAVQYIRQGPIFFSFDGHLIDKLMLVIELGMAALVLTLAFKHKQWLVLLLQITQLGFLGWFEFSHMLNMPSPNYLFVDSFSAIMALIIGIIGGVICLYALSYMKDFHHHHPEFTDRRKSFFFIMFAFLSAMFGIVFANNLLWLFFFWEVTTLASFLLIGYKRDAISTTNAFHALKINLAGGLFFFVGILYLIRTLGIVELDKMLGIPQALALVPVVCFAIAGITKSAQMPFSSWLLGAMVAPTPVSALLHSSTMVKAGVYLIVKMSPLLHDTFAGMGVATVGAITFLVTSFIAVSQSDAKRVLAYSTVANLGLIVLCAGIGTPEAMWAAILLIIFHAIAKGLLFLCVGYVEHHVGDRNIESMDALVVKMPKTAWMMLTGMAGMFLAPFGMLISKWIVLRALIDASPIMTIFIVFGSAATLFFWGKWMGKLLLVTTRERNVECFDKDEALSLFPLAGLTVLVCLFFPIISSSILEPYIAQTLSANVMSLGQGNMMIMIGMMALVILFRLSIHWKKQDHSDPVSGPYLAGRGLDEGNSFRGSFNTPTAIHLKSYYLENVFSESLLSTVGIVSTIIVLIVLLTRIAL